MAAKSPSNRGGSSASETTNHADEWSPSSCLSQPLPGLQAADNEPSDEQREAAFQDFRARLRAARAGRHLTTRQRPAEGLSEPAEGSAGGTASTTPDAALGTTENRVSGKIAEPPSNLRKLERKYEPRNDRRKQRMRWLDEMRRFTKLPSVKACGAMPLGGAVAVTRAADGKGGFSGLTRCGSVWSCPECQPVVRAERAAELERGALAWTETGHALGMVTLTTRHWSRARLAPQIEGTAMAWRKLQAGGWWGRFRERFGVVGVTRAMEMTHSWANSWHTHLHVVFWFEQDLTKEQREACETALYERWARLVKKEKLGTPTRKHGVRLDMASRGKEGAADIAKYVVKLDSGAALGNELLRGDLKVGRHKGRTPFEILARAILGDEAELELWAEYETATKGHRMLTWGGDIRDRLAELIELDDRTGAEIAAAEDAAAKEILVRVAAKPWRETVAAVVGRRGRVVGAAEAGGRDAVVQLLEAWGLEWGTDILPPVDPIVGEDPALTPDQPARREHRQRERWKTVADLYADQALLGIAPRDNARPERARRRAAGLPVSK